MNSTEKHELREHRRVSAILKRRMNHMNKSFHEMLAEILREMTPTIDEMTKRIAEFADAVNNPVDNG